MRRSFRPPLTLRLLHLFNVVIFWTHVRRTRLCFMMATVNDIPSTMNSYTIHLVQLLTVRLLTVQFHRFHILDEAGHIDRFTCIVYVGSTVHRVRESVSITEKQLRISNFKILVIELDFLQRSLDKPVLSPVDVGTVVQSPNNHLYLVLDRIIL